MSAALIVSSASADVRCSLAPLAAALATLTGRTDHVVLRPVGVDEETRTVSLPAAMAAPPGVNRIEPAVTAFPDTRSIIGWRGSSAIDKWASQPCPELDRSAAMAGVILIQAGEAVAMANRLRSRASKVRLVYLATRSLAGGPSRMRGLLARHGHRIDAAVGWSASVMSELAFLGSRACLVSAPFDPVSLPIVGKTPYRAGPNVAVIGHGGLDAVAIEIVASAYPDARFHLVGPADAPVRANVDVLGALSSADTKPYLAHADVVLVADAAADEAEVEMGLASTLAMVDHLGIPIVCPAALSQDAKGRHGFDPGRTASVREALGSAMRHKPRRSPAPAPTWSDLARRLLTETPFADMGAEPARIRGAAYAG